MKKINNSGEKNNNKRVLLIIPNNTWNGKRPTMIVNYASLIITAMLKDRFDFDILDANGENLSKESCARRIKDFDPGIILITTLSVEYYQQYHDASAIARAACPGCTIIMGGIYPTVMETETLDRDENLDYIMVGHAEERLDKFLDILISKNEQALEAFDGIGYRKNSEIIFRPVKTYVSEVKKQVKPDYSKTNLELYIKNDSTRYQVNSLERYATILTSYGCQYNCLFCAVRTISGKKIAFRPVEDVIEEIDYLVKNYRIKNLVFMDDCMLADKKRVESLLNKIIDNKYGLTFKISTVSAWHCTDDVLELLKKAGCTQITVSVESGCPRVLREIIRKPLKLDIIPGIVKKCKDLKIDLGANFVIGFPGEKWDEIRETFAFAEKNNFDLVNFSIATPLPKTDLYELAKSQNLLPDNFSFFDPAYFSMSTAFINTDEFSAKELEILRAFEWDRINFSTPERTAKIGKMMCLSLPELDKFRRETRRKFGKHY